VYLSKWRYIFPELDTPSVPFSRLKGKAPIVWVVCFFVVPVSYDVFFSEELPNIPHTTPLNVWWYPSHSITLPGPNVSFEGGLPPLSPYITTTALPPKTSPPPKNLRLRVNDKPPGPFLFPLTVSLPKENKVLRRTQGSITP